MIAIWPISAYQKLKFNKNNLISFDRPIKFSILLRLMIVFVGQGQGCMMRISTNFVYNSLESFTSYYIQVCSTSMYTKNEQYAEQKHEYIELFWIEKY